MRYTLYVPLLFLTLITLVANSFAQESVQAITPLHVKHTVRADYQLEQGWIIEEEAIEDSIHALMGETIMPAFKTTVTKTTLTQTVSIIHGTIELSNTFDTPIRIDSISPRAQDANRSELRYSKSIPVELNPGEKLKCEYTLKKKGAAPKTASFDYHGESHIPLEETITPITAGELLSTANETVSVELNGVHLGSSSRDFSWISTNEVVCTRDTFCQAFARILETGQSDQDTVSLICKKISLTLTGQTQGKNLHHWSITKTASQDELQLNMGDSQEVSYTIAVTKDSIVATNFTQGHVKISNPSSTPLAASLNLHLNENQTIDTETSTDVSIVLLPGNNTFAFEFHSSAKDTSATIVAELNIKGTSFHREFKITTPQNEQNIQEHNASISVQDGETQTLWKDIKESSEWTYTQSITANKDYHKANEQGIVVFQVESKASILETNQSAIATTQVKQYVPQITQSSSASYYRDSQWDLKVTAAPEQHAFCGEKTEIKYSLTAEKQSKDHHLTIDGSVHIFNPSPSDAMQLSVHDILNHETIIFQDLDSSETLEIQPQETRKLRYSYVSEQSIQHPENHVSIELNDMQIQQSHLVSFEKGTIIEETNASTLIRDNFGLVTPTPLTKSTTFVVSRPFNTAPLKPEDVSNEVQRDYIENAFKTSQNPDSPIQVGVQLYRYKPLLSKVIKTQLLHSYNWDITKTVSDQKINLLVGGEQELNYQVSVEKKQATPVYVLQGSITLENPHPTKDLHVKLTEEVNGEKAPISGLDNSGYATIPAGTTQRFTYEVRSSKKPSAGSAITRAKCELNTLETELAYNFDDVSERMAEENASITIEDSFNHTTWSNITKSSTFEYSQKVSSKGISQSDFIDGVYHFSVPSSARIIELDKSDSVNVEVNCYAPIYSQSTRGSYVDSYEWFAVKTSDSTNMTANEGEALNIPFEIAVNAIPSQIHKKLAGNITIYNPHPTEEMQVDLYAYYDLRLLNLSESTVFIAPLSHLSVNYDEAVETTTGSYSDIQLYVNDVEFYSSELIKFEPDPKAHNSEVRVEDNMMSSTLGVVNAKEELPVYFTYNVQLSPTYTGQVQTISNTVNLIGTEEDIQASSTFDVKLKVLPKKDQKSNDILQEETINYTVYPNPSQKEANFSITIQSSADVELNIYDSTGTLLKELMNKRVETDIEKTIYLPFKKEPGKIYFYKIRINGVSTSGTLIPG